MSETIRVDQWVWAVRCVKTRSAATTACRAGHVRVNGQTAKAAQQVRVGDEVRVRLHGFDRILIVRQLLAKRVGAEPAAAAYDDLTPPPPTAMEAQMVPRRDRGAGRPTKRERRDLDRLRGRDSGGRDVHGRESRDADDEGTDVPPRIPPGIPRAPR